MHEGKEKVKKMIDVATTDAPKLCMKHDSQNSLTGKTEGDMGRKLSAVKEEKDADVGSEPRKSLGTTIKPSRQEPYDSPCWLLHRHVLLYYE